MNITSALYSATMGQPKKLRPMIFWTLAEYFFRGAPYGFGLMVIWEIFKPLQDQATSLDVQKIIWACVGIAVSLIFLYIFSRKAYFASYEAGYDITAEGRKEVARHLKKLPMGFYNSRDPGDIGAYIVSDYANIEQMVTHMVPQFFGALAMPAVLVASLFAFSWQLALATFLVIPLSYPMLLLTNKIVATLGGKHQKTKIESASRMIEYIQGIKLIKSFNLGGEKFERLEKAFRKLKKDSIKLEAAPGPSIIFASVILNSGIVLIILLGFSLLLSSEVPLAVYILFLVMGIHVYQPLIHAMTFMAEMNYMKMGAERIEELINTKPLPDGDEKNKIENHQIEFKNVNFSYHNTKVIDHFSYTIPEKSLTAFVGPSGSGKTTLTRLIARFWDVESGEVKIGGQNIKSFTSDYLMSKISIVFQDVYLFNDSIYNNIRIGKEEATKEEIVQAAKIAQCYDFIMELPKQFETLIGEGGNTLSGGEKQRISIARAILKNAPIILLDEATASLDPENEIYIQKAIDDLIRNKTVIIIAHRLQTIQNADQIIVLDKGQKKESGTHEELLQNKALYYNLWTEQQRIKGWKF